MPRCPLAGSVAAVERRTRRLLLWAAGIAAALVLAGAAVLVTFAVQFSGGWDDVLDFSRPAPGDPDVVAARLAGAAAVDAEMTRVSRQVVLPAMAGARVALPAPTGPSAAPDASDGGPGDRATGSYCDIGQHNWKRDDPYDVECREVRREILAGQAPTLAADLRAIHAALLAAGYVPAGDGLPERIAPLENAADSSVGPDSPSADQPNPPEAPYISAWYRAGALSAHVSTGLYDMATDDQPDLAPGEYPLALEVTLTSYQA